MKLSYCNLEQVPESIVGLSCLEQLNLEGNNLEHVPNAIGGLSCLMEVKLEGNNFTSLPGSLSQLSNLEFLDLCRCKKLEVLPELPSRVHKIDASDCTSLREVLGSLKNQFMNRCNRNCPKLFQNDTIDSEGSISKTQCLDSSITSQGSIHQVFALLGYLGFPTNRCQFFSQYIRYYCLDIAYHGNSVPEWFTNRSTENHVKVELPTHWSYNKFRGFGICIVFKCKKRRPFLQQEAHLSMLRGIPTPTQDGGMLFLSGDVDHLTWAW
nr:NB-ARC domains-containing protein [Tanacetum cinerariifolium]